MISSEDKLKITRKRLLELGLGENSCIAYGDSNSDLALFENLQHTVAVNAEDQIRKLATAIYQGDDLWAAYTTGRKLLDTQGQ
jgi:phosphoserine phosphatase